MNITFVGSVIDPGTQQRRPASSTAGNRYQLGLLKGAASRGAQISAISVEPHRMWTRPGDRLWIRGTSRVLAAGLRTRTVSFINVPGLKQLCIAVNTFWKLFRLRSGGSIQSGDHVILVYNSLSYQFFPCLVAKKMLGCRLGVIVADLPLSPTREGLSRWMEKLEHSLEVKSLGYADFLVPLTKHTQTDFAPYLPAVVVEGGQETAARLNRSRRRSERLPRQLVYAGSLNSVSGIDLAIEAVRRIPPGEVLLNIYGAGTPGQVAAVKAAQSDNIVFHGPIGHEAVLDLERQADLLLSPRRPDAFVTRYTFPSKLLEYLASGTPVMSNRLEGIPDDYLPYLNIPEAASPEPWAEMIQTICSDVSGAYESRANKAVNFVREQKSWNKQAARMVDFLRQEVLDVQQ